jgi:hypothetical protein
MVEIAKTQLKQAYDICMYAKNKASSGYQFEQEFSTFLLA